MTGDRRQDGDPGLPRQTGCVSRSGSDNKTFRFGRFSAWPLGLCVFLLINAAAFFDDTTVRGLIVAPAVLLFLVWFRLRVRVTPTHLEVRNLLSQTRLALDDPDSKIWVDNGALWVSIGAEKPVRAWGADGNKKSRNESAPEKLEALCTILLHRTFRRDGASLDF